MHRDEGGTERERANIREVRARDGGERRGVREREKESHADAAASQTKTRHD